MPKSALAASQVGWSKASLDPGLTRHGVQSATRENRERRMDSPVTLSLCVSSATVNLVKAGKTIDSISFHNFKVF